MRVLLLPLFVLVAACAPQAPLALGPDHPASPEAYALAHTMPVAALEPAPAPRLPAALRPALAEGHGGMSHGAAHTAMRHAEASRPPAETGALGQASTEASSEALPASGPMAEALGAYLAVQDALASDDATGAVAHGAHFARDFDVLAEASPAGDPHFWHSRSDAVEAVRDAASDLAEAADLAAARLAFGHLSVPFARLVEEAGLPEGLTLDRYRCGMARDVPDGGIWLQRPGATRNPYFGAAMLTCGTRTGSLAAGAGPASHGTHGDH